MWTPTRPRIVSTSSLAASPLTIQITNAGPGTLNWTASTGTFRGTTAGSADWLSLSATSGTAPTIVTVNVSTTGLLPGTYLGEVVFQAEGGNVSVPVTLVVSNAQNNMFQEVPGLNFTMMLGGANPPPQSFTVASTGSVLNFSPVTTAGSGGSNWLTVSSPCEYCTTPTTFPVTVNGSKLPAGVYVGEMVLTGDASAVVPITLAVIGPTGPSNLLSAAPAALSYSYDLGAGAVPVQILSITASGNPIAYTTTVNSGASWLQVSSGDGTTPGYTVVSVNPVNLAIGKYSGSFTVSSQFSSPVNVPVSLTVTQNSLLLSQAAITFSYQAGTASPAPQLVNVTSAGAGLSYAAAVAQGAPWLSITNGLGATPGSVQISANPGNLANGTYSGSINFTAPLTPSVSLPVTLTIVGTTSLSVSASSLTFMGSGSQLIAIGTNGPSIPFTLAAATGSGGSWLAVSPASGTAPANGIRDSQRNRTFARFLFGQHHVHRTLSFQQPADHSCQPDGGGAGFAHGEPSVFDVQYSAGEYRAAIPAASTHR
jgi:hypothetical protein